MGSGSQQWNTVDTPEMLCMLIAKLPGRLVDRWNNKIQAIRKTHLHEPSLQDLIKFVEEKTVLRNDPLFSREALHKARKLKKWSFSVTPLLSIVIRYLSMLYMLSIDSIYWFLCYFYKFWHYLSIILYHALLTDTLGIYCPNLYHCR